MFHSLALAATVALAPAQSGELRLTNVRNTYGEQGTARPDTKFLPGDVLFVAFDIEGITVNPEGQVKYTMAMEVIDAQNKPIFKQDPADKLDFVPLGGNKLPARAFVTIGIDQPAGAYTVRLTVIDTGSPRRATATLERKFEVLKKDFGVVAVYTSVDAKGELPAPTTGVIGQAVFVQVGVVGFERQAPPAPPGTPANAPKKDPQPNVSMEMMPFDDQGKPTLAKPVTFVMNDGLMGSDMVFTMRFLLPLTRVGKYKVRLKATDNVSKKTASFELPVTVLPQPS